MAASKFVIDSGKMNIAATSSFVLFIIVQFFASANLQRNDTDEPGLNRVRRIIGGSSASILEHRWVVSLQARHKSSIEAALTGSTESFCGGTLISKKWILTAAHCLYGKNANGKNYEKPKYWHVRIENNSLKPKAIDKIVNLWNRFVNSVFGSKQKQNFYHVSAVIRHPDYIPGILENDIALMKLKEDLDFGSNPSEAFLPIPPEGSDNLSWPQEGNECTVLGWGCGVADGPPTKDVQKLRLPIVSPSKCRLVYVTNINLTDTKEFCAGYYEENKGICPGDSGGPIACELNGRLHLAGVVSATHAKKPEDYPGIFTRVSYYAPWIRRVMKQY